MYYLRSKGITLAALGPCCDFEQDKKDTVLSYSLAIFFKEWDSHKQVNRNFKMPRQSFKK